MNTKYTRVYTVGCGDMDVNYRLTKIAAAKFFQETFAMNCARHNLAAFDVCKQNLVWVISDLHIEFSATMPYWSEEFSVEIWISEKTKMRTYCDFQIYYKNNVIAKGDSCWYLLDMDTRRPVKSDEVLCEFNADDEKVFGCHKKYIYKFEGTRISEKEHEVTVRDLDFNYHVNNLSYIGLTLETVPPVYLEKYCITSYNVKFVHEAYLSDILCCEIYEKDNEILSRIYKKNDNTDVCLISSTYCNKTDFSRNPREAGVTFL